MFTKNQEKVLRQAIKSLAPEATISINQDPRRTGSIASNPTARKVAEFNVSNRSGIYGTLDLDDNGQKMFNSNKELLGFRCNYNATATALHELAHVAQTKVGIMAQHSYAMMEITAEYCAMKLMQKYFSNQYDESQEQASRFYISTYYNGHSPIVTRNQKLTSGEVANFKAMAESIIIELMPIIEPIAQEMAKA